MAAWPDWLILHLVNNSTLSTNRFKAKFQPSKDQFYKIKKCFQRSNISKMIKRLVQKNKTKK